MTLSVLRSCASKLTWRWGWCHLLGGVRAVDHGLEYVGGLGAARLHNVAQLSREIAAARGAIALHCVVDLRHGLRAE